jgi:hypothetical protein
MLLMAASAGSAYAQAPPDNTPRAGVEVGLNASYYAVTEGGESDMKAAPVVGVFTVLRRGKMVMIQPEIQYSQRRTPITVEGIESDFAVDYLNLSLLVRMRLFKGLYVTEGPQFSVPVRAKRAGVDVKGNTQPDISILIGLGRQVGRMGFEARWDSGLKAIEKTPTHGVTKRNRSITGLAIIKF